MAHDPLRELPAVSRLLAHPRTERLLVRFNREYVVRGCRDVLAELRHSLSSGHPFDAQSVHLESILTRLESRLFDTGDPGLQRVVNATGTVLHTNLGRALLATSATDAVVRAATQSVNLEYDLVQGERGRREQAVEALVKELTGAEAATVVNNNAAAVLLVLNTLANGREVIVSRGELVEIGGAFRIPDIMARSGAILREVGTTNRTHPSDYEGAITDRTALLLRVHTSNYKIVGFVADVGLPELAAIGARHGIPVMEDLGSGALIDLSSYGLPKEPVVAERIAHGADLVTFSGDKVLGGPQAGIVAGKAVWLESINRNPLHRALRCGKLTIAALEATLRLYRESTAVTQDIPALRAFTRPLAEVEDTARRALPSLASALGSEYRLSVQDSTSQMGSGALPTDDIPTKVIVVEHDSMAAHRIAERFRHARPPIIGRVKDSRFLLDARAIFDPLDLVPHWADTALTAPLPA
jgi:L-seryl-tRNA(Ser) seleniumtransferase